MFGFDAAAWLAVEVYESIIVGVLVEAGQSFVCEGRHGQDVG